MNLTEAHDVIEASVSMPDLAEELGLEIQRNGTNLYVLCPNPEHNDRRASNCVLYDKNAYCFACHKSWDAIGLVMEVRHCNFMEAVAFLSDLYGLGINFKSDVKPVPPLIIEKSVFTASGINDTAAFKKLYEQSHEVAMQYLSCCVFDARKKHKAAMTDEMPAEAKYVLEERIATLTDAQKNLPQWRKKAKTSPLRIK